MNAAGVLIVLFYPPEAPPLSDLDRFPSPAIVAEAIARADAEIELLRKRKLLDLVYAVEYQRCIDAASRARDPWLALRAAQSESAPPGWPSWVGWEASDRRQSLAAFRSLIGPADYAAGRFSPR